MNWATVACGNLLFIFFKLRCSLRGWLLKAMQHVLLRIYLHLFEKNVNFFLSTADSLPKRIPTYFSVLLKSLDYCTSITISQPWWCPRPCVPGPILTLTGQSWLRSKSYSLGSEQWMMPSHKIIFSQETKRHRREQRGKQREKYQQNHLSFFSFPP